MSKTTTLITGILSASMITAAGCNNESLPPVPEGTDCNDWEWEDDEGVWECDDYDSSHYGYFFYGGKSYSSKSSLKSSSAYQSYKSSSSFKGGSSGFGKGSSGGFGG
ncbi:hypothetical protein [Metabacillus sediminilitoris]|uniref:hypothetical protein n=1 Tax=Metabacillus sediminilitoris TaxID=2567941 RepID=UPI0012D7AF62|nr:hypothetical protein [Metabacillus sediminilitoris]QGQ45008.1 hypothetical protein GMB29_06855 [Metabacillus sediminilitoris]